MLNEQEHTNVEQEIEELEVYNREPNVGESQRHINNQRLLCLYAGYRLQPDPIALRLIHAVSLSTGEIVHTFSYLELLYAKFDIVRLLEDREKELLSSLVVKEEVPQPQS